MKGQLFIATIMAATREDKATALHINNVDSTDNSDLGGNSNRHSGELSANEDIVRHLQTTGEVSHVH